jgi:polar amino acid transport system permease protein
LAVTGRQVIERSEQAIAISKTNPAALEQIDQALERLRAKGELARLSQKYFSEDITRPPSDSQPIAALPALAPAAGPATDDKSAARDAHPVAHFFRVLVDSSPLFVRAAGLTFRLTAVAIAVACIIGLVFAFMRLSRLRLLNAVSTGYVYLVRGTPLIVQIFVLYFGLTSVVKIPSFWAAALALAFHNGAYIAEIFRGAIQSIDRGQMEAARALGMSSTLGYRRIVLPQAALRALPSLGNQLIIALKDSSLAAFISMNELFNVATTQGANHFDQMTYLLVVAVYYLVLVLMLQMLVQWMENKLGRGKRRLHALVSHGDTVGNRDGGEFARRSCGGGYALLHRLRLAHQRDVTGRAFVPAGRDPNQGLMDLLVGQPHRVKVRAVRRARRPLCYVPARQPRFVDVIGIHWSRSPPSSVFKGLKTMA